MNYKTFILGICLMHCSSNHARAEESLTHIEADNIQHDTNHWNVRTLEPNRWSDDLHSSSQLSSTTQIMDIRRILTKFHSSAQVLHMGAKSNRGNRVQFTQQLKQRTRKTKIMSVLLIVSGAAVLCLNFVLAAKAWRKQRVSATEDKDVTPLEQNAKDHPSLSQVPTSALQSAQNTLRNTGRQIAKISTSALQ